MLDIEGTLKTAALNNINVLILGASGCGAFKHDPAIEAELWRGGEQEKNKNKKKKKLFFS